MTPSQPATVGLRHQLRRRIGRPLGRLRRRVLLHRRPLAALSAGGAVLVGLQAASPPPPPTVTAWVASRDLAGGTPLSAGDLTRTRLDPASVPGARISDPRPALGRTLAAPMAAGEVLTEARLLGRDLLDGYPGSTAVPVRITDAAVVDLLRVGDRVDLVAADPDGRTTARTLAFDATVVALPRQRSGAFAAGAPGRLVVLAVPTGAAAEVAAAAVTDFTTVLWSP